MKRFTKEDLKPGMIVEYMNGKYFVIEDENDLHIFKEDLTNRYSPCLDIKRVYIDNPAIETLFDNKFYSLIWERKEMESITTNEAEVKIEELTGEKIKIEPSTEIMRKTLSLNCMLNDCCDCIFEEECSGFDSLITPGKIKSNYEKLMGGIR